MDDQEKLWPVEFERLGEQQVYDNMKQGAIYNDERKRQAAFRWLGEQASKRRQREENTYWYAQYTFYAAVIAAILGFAGIVVALLTAR